MLKLNAVVEAIAPKIGALKILMIEQDPVMRMGLIHFLKQYSALQIVGQARDGLSGITEAKRLQPDLVILDLDAPGVNCQNTIQQLKAAAPQVRVLILTHHPREATSALINGANAYCLKGSSREKLLVAIASLQGGATYLDQDLRSWTIFGGAERPQKSSNHWVFRGQCVSPVDPEIARQVYKQLRTPTQVRPKANFSERELAVLRLLVQGCTNTEIAASLYLSPSTVKTHLRNIMNKLAVADRVQVAVTALRAGLV